MFTVSQIVDAVDGKIIQSGEGKKISGVSIDSRAIKPSELFIAITGEKHDAHVFLPSVVKRGVKTVLVSKPVKLPSVVTIIQVKDATKALGLLGAAYRQRFKIPVIAITGSAGKTTTKEILAAILQQKFKTLKSEKSLNNQFGVPLTLLKLRPSHQAAVLELGTNHPGEIAWLSAIARPTICLFINIGESHLEGLRNKAGIFKEKSQMINFMQDKTGAVVYNQDDAFLRRIAKMNIPQKRWGYSIDNPSTFRADRITVDKTNRIIFFVQRKKIRLTHPGKHLVYNALGAIVCARLLNVGFPSIQRGLDEVGHVSGRQEILTIKGSTVINDSYNANPTSFASAVETLASIPTRGRRIVICGDMLELGSQAEIKHREAALKILALKINLVLATGKWMQYCVDTIKKKKTSVVAMHFATVHDLLKYLETININHDAILIKGSRGMRMEQAVEHLRKIL